MFELKDIEAAVADYDKAIEMDPALVEACGFASAASPTAGVANQTIASAELGSSVWHTIFLV